ncbi:hypothetical protein JCM33374_g4923 [Metschnikowia sp. JCM 33374]|nr:hypothetical protein JCM33374_g4923 [Metschnikowia sp. JCM 33374]
MRKSQKAQKSTERGEKKESIISESNEEYDTAEFVFALNYICHIYSVWLDVNLGNYLSDCQGYDFKAQLTKPQQPRITYPEIYSIVKSNTQMTSLVTLAFYSFSTNGIFKINDSFKLQPNRLQITSPQIGINY